MPMPGLRQVFTLIFVPHNEARPRSISMRWSALLILASLFTVTAFFALFLSFVGVMSNPYRVHRKMTDYRQQVALLEEQTEELSSWKETIDSLETELEKMEQQHVRLLELTGFASLTAAQANQDTSSQLQRVVSLEKLDETKKLLQRNAGRNKQLQQLQNFVKNRNQVFDNTPMLWPTEGWVSSPYGYRQHPMGGRGRSHHDGVDLAAWHGTPIRATADGKAIFTGWNGGYGKTITLEHAFGYETLYAHLSEIDVSRGQKVKKGEVIGKVGATGYATGSHLHYEVRVNGDAVDPEPYMIENYNVFSRFNNQEE